MKEPGHRRGYLPQERQALRVPVFVIFLWICGAAMLAPASVALIEDDHSTARAFLYGAMMVGFLALLLSLTTRSRRNRDTPREQLLTLVGAYAALPLVMAVPFQQAVGGTLSAAWFEMLSSATTTGGTLFDQGQFVPRGAHLWRAIVAWLGGFLAWVSAIAVLAPMNLGGFEVRAPRDSASSARIYAEINRLDDPTTRLTRYGLDLAPLYAGLTFVLFVGLLIGGDDELVALIHAMSVISTSGISPIMGLTDAKSGYFGEFMIFIFFIFALARSSFTPTVLGPNRMRLHNDPEMHLGLGIIAASFLLLYARHWIGTTPSGEHATDSLKALWGTLFTVASFLTTTGFESNDWGMASFWSGVSTPGVLFVGLAMIGGGVATTAGGVKLMRIYVLGQHIRQEVGQLVHPHMVQGTGRQSARGRSQGAYIAWVLFMLFALTLAAVMLALALLGIPFETSMVLTVAALSNCGPLAQIAAEIPVSFANTGPVAQAILAAAMVVGRLEALAIIALLNREIWR